MKELINIQCKLKAPKGQYNSFGRYKYRSCEDILESVKPLLSEQGCVLTLADDVLLVGERFYIKATATITNAEGVTVTTTALAREDEAMKGLGASQITGCASSYARKYALNGLFCIDDTKDADTDEHQAQATTTVAKTSAAPAADSLDTVRAEVMQAKDKATLMAIWKKYPQFATNRAFTKLFSDAKQRLGL